MTTVPTQRSDPTDGERHAHVIVVGAGITGLSTAIMLLDDPTAAIDSETEHEIFAALDRAIEGRTTFIVAHRLSTLRRADFIIVLEDGRIVQRGTHEELMRVPGPYLRVADLQLVDARELARLTSGGAA